VGKQNVRSFGSALFAPQAHSHGLFVDSEVRKTRDSNAAATRLKPQPRSG